MTPMSQHQNIVAATPGSDSIGIAEPEILHLDPDVATLFAEVDAILCAALSPYRCPPAPPAIGCALVAPRLAGLSCGVLLRGGSAPARPIRAVQRGPPRSADNRRANMTTPCERQVVTAHQT